MARRISSERLESEIARLPVPEQLKLIARVSSRLGGSSPGTMARISEQTEPKVPAGRKVAEILALCDAAAREWKGEFDSVRELRGLRQERDEQLWSSGS